MKFLSPVLVTGASGFVGSHLQTSPGSEESESKITSSTLAAVCFFPFLRNWKFAEVM